MGAKVSKGNIEKQYVFKNQLGKGAFAVVKRAVRKSDGKDFAIKIIKKDNLSTDDLAIVQDEVDIMQKITHPHCVQLYDFMNTKKTLYMVMELLTGGELFDSIVENGQYSEHDAAIATKAMAEGIRYLHGIGVVHRDLKPENLIYDSAVASKRKLKITDFGLAKHRKDGQRMATACGTPGYVAPEVLMSSSTTKYGPEVDLWSLGVIVYILLCGFPPFYHENTQELYKQIKSGHFEFIDPYWTDISQAAKDLIKGLLTVNPKKRFTPDQVLSHPWVARGDEVASKKAFSKDHNLHFRKLQARKILRRGVRSIIAVNRFARALQEIIVKQHMDKQASS